MNQKRISPPEGKVSGFLTPARIVGEMVPERYPEFLAAVPTSTRELIESPPLAMAWRPLEHFPAIVNAALQVFDGELGLIEELAERSLRADLSTLYRIFIRISSPDAVLDRAPAVWNTYLRGAGACTVTDSGHRMRTLTYSDVPFPSRGYWAYQAGAALGVVHATGTTGGTAKIVAGGSYANSCSIRINW